MASAGDRELLNRLVLEHVPDALRLVIRLTRRSDLAEEIVQEALCRAARSAHTFRGEAQFRTWFFRIVLNALRDHFRWSARRETQEDVEGLVDPRAVDPANAVEFGELGELIAASVSKLPPRQREVLVLVTYQGFSPREVATVLGISESNVHAQLHYARARLRSELAPYLTEE
jgi:RNA polymerase sigma-70 factor, ECF subfamily